MKTFFILLGIIFLLEGCSEHSVNPNPPSPQKQIYPLATGDVRIYVDTLFYSDGSVAHVAFDTEWVGMSVLVNGEMWFVVSNGIYPRGDLYANRSDGYWGWWNNQKFQIYKYPDTVGDRYNDRIDTVLNDRDHFQAFHMYTKVFSINEPIQVRDSVYFCYHMLDYDYFFNDIDTGSTPEGYEFVCPGIGPIRGMGHFDEIIFKDGTTIKNGTESTTLIAYHLK